VEFLSCWGSYPLPCGSTYTTTQSPLAFHEPPTCYRPLLVIRIVHQGAVLFQSMEGFIKDSLSFIWWYTSNSLDSRRQLSLTRLSDQQAKNVTIVSLGCATVHVRLHAVQSRGTLEGNTFGTLGVNLGI
jgi:hypothetical protein